MTMAIVLSGIAFAGMCAWMVNKLLPVRDTTVAAMDIASPINYQKLGQGSNLANLERGRSYYAQLCMSCHGGSGDGNGEWAYRVTPRPADLRSPRARGRSDEQLFSIISEGLPGTSMVGMKAKLSTTQRWQIVEYLRHLMFGEEQLTAND